MSGAIKRFEREFSEKEKKQRIKIKRSEEYEYLNGVFDKPTLLTIYKLLNEGVISELNGVISTGKESKVFHATGKDGELAVKIYFTGNLEFKKSIKKYIIGDPRFVRVKGKISSVIEEWAKKEFVNLKTYWDAGVRVPKPFIVRRNVLVMEFIGENGVSAPLIKDVELEDPNTLYEKIVGYIKIGVKRAQLVHGDLSEYNILLFNAEPVIIDVSQAVDINHPLARELLNRDLERINSFFSKFKTTLYDKDSLIKELLES